MNSARPSWNLLTKAVTPCEARAVNDQVRNYLTKTSLFCRKKARAVNIDNEDIERMRSSLCFADVCVRIYGLNFCLNRVKFEA